MPKLKQPEKLETLCLNRSAEWLHQVGLNLLPLITKMTRIDQKDAMTELNLVIEVVHSYFECFVPFSLYKKLTDAVIKVISGLIAHCKEAIDFRVNMAKFLCQMNVAVRLSEALVSIKLRIMNFDELPKMIRSNLYIHMPKMSGLEFLNLGSVSGGWKTFEMEPMVLRGLENMCNLRHLSLSYDCTDEILRLLVRKCPQLASLDVTNSKYVNNDSIIIMTQLKKLKFVQLYRTQVTMQGYIDLLLHLPDLLDVGRYDELGRCLEFIDQYHPTYKNFALKQFVSICSTTKQLRILCEKCPNIESVALFHNVLLLDLMALIGLNKLSKLKLLACDFFADQVRDILQVKGCNITNLNLEHVDEIDMNALIYISQFCPDLKSLTLCNCNLIESTSLYYQKYQIPPFMNLEELTLVGECKFQHIEFIMFHAYKIKFIHFGTQIPTNDQLLEKIFLNNQLSHLEEFRILHSDFLTIKSAYNLINNCKSLSKLYEIESWIQVLPFELEQLKNYIKIKNFDVDLTSYRKFVT